MKEKDLLPNKAIWMVKQDYPDIFDFLKLVRSNREVLGVKSWVKWCYMPVSLVYACLNNTKKEEGLPTEDNETFHESLILASLFIWSTGKSIYRFDEDVYESLIKTPPNKIPAEILYRLPEWGVYIETPNFILKEDDKVLNIDGFFAHLDDGSGDKKLLNITYSTNTGLIGFSLNIAENNIEDMFKTMVEDNIIDDPDHDDVINGLNNAFRKIIALLLYICSEKPDYKGEPPKKARIKNIGRIQKTLTATKTTVREVGFNVGKQIRSAREAIYSHNNSNDPIKRVTHIRKAHYHSFWTGKRDGQKELIVKWLAPILVNSDGQEFPITIKKVSKK